MSARDGWDRAAVRCGGAPFSLGLLQRSSVGPTFTFSNTVIDSEYDNLNVAVVPEPATLALLASGLIGSALARRRNRRRDGSATAS